MKNGFLFLTLLVTLQSQAQAQEIRFERNASVPMVYLNIAIKAGSAHDPKGQSGITNFMGEMLLRGTRKHTREALNLALDQIGARLEVETRTEALILRGAVVSSKLQQFLDLLAEVITTPRFSESEIGKLKTEVVSMILEERGRDQALARKRWESFLHEGHPYGNPISGRLQDVERLSRSAIVGQYRRLFQRDHLIVVGSGDAEEAYIRTWAEKVSGLLPASQGSSLAKVDPQKSSQRMRVRIIDKPERTQTQLYVGQTGVRMDDPRFFALFTGNHTFGGGSFSARLMHEIREKKGWSYGAYSYFRHGLQPRSWQAYTFPATKDTPDALAKILSMIREMRESGVTDGEFDFARKSLVNGAGFMYNTPKKRVENILLERTLELPDGFMKTYGTRIGALGRKEVNQAWASFLTPETSQILVLGTAKDLLPRIAKALQIPESSIEVVSYTKE